MAGLAVGMPFESPGAHWLSIDEGRPEGLQPRTDIQLRRTDYDLEAAAGEVRRTAFPDAEQFASVYIQQPPDMLQTFTQYGLEALKVAGHGA